MSKTADIHSWGERMRTVLHDEKRKEEFRKARAYNFRCAWRLGEDIFALLKTSDQHTHSNVSRTIATKGMERIIEIATFSPWIRKDEKTEIRAVKIEEQKLPTKLGRLVFRKGPEEPESVQFALDVRPPNSKSVILRHATLEWGHQPDNRIYYPTLSVIPASDSSHYETWNDKDLSTTRGLAHIYNRLEEQK